MSEPLIMLIPVHPFIFQILFLTRSTAPKIPLFAALRLCVTFFFARKDAKTQRKTPLLTFA
jgi:hypothetical protein